MSNIITIETDIEPPLVAVAMGDWNALNRAYEAALARAEAAENDLRELRENTLLALGHNRPALEDIMKLQHPPNGHRLKQELAAALARAEAAERERDTLRALSIRVEDGGTIYNFDKALAAIPDGANIENITVKIDHNMELAPLKAHIAELETQLAAQAWRPVTEPPQMADDYHVWRRPGYHDFCHFNGVNWRTTGGDSVTHWQPLPAPPIDPPAPA